MEKAKKEKPSIVAIQGSPRPGSYTEKALALVLDELKTENDMEIISINPVSLKLPFPGAGAPSEGSKFMEGAISSATGVVLATPEYHGSFSSLMKLAIENMGFPSVLAGKPVALLGVAAGRIGAIKSLEQLRSVCSHVGAIVLPGPVSVANVQHVFDTEGRCLDKETEKAIRGVAHSLVEYIHQNLCPRLALEEMVRGEDKVKIGT